MTRSALPTFVDFNVKAISVGVNPMTAPPAVPNPCVWKFNETVDVIMTYHKGGYPNNPGPDPKHPGGISRRDCTIVEGLEDVLCFAFRTDNSGPPESIQVLYKSIHSFITLTNKQKQNTCLMFSPSTGDFLVLRDFARRVSRCRYSRFNVRVVRGSTVSGEKQTSCRHHGDC